MCKLCYDKRWDKTVIQTGRLVGVVRDAWTPMRLSENCGLCSLLFLFTISAYGILHVWPTEKKMVLSLRHPGIPVMNIAVLCPQLGW